MKIAYILCMFPFDFGLKNNYETLLYGLKIPENHLLLSSTNFP